MILHGGGCNVLLLLRVAVSRHGYGIHVASILRWVGAGDDV